MVSSILTLVVVAATCIADSDVKLINISGIRPGMTVKQVQRIAGNPVRASRSGQRETWIYFGEKGMLVELVRSQVVAVSGGRLFCGNTQLAMKGDALSALESVDTLRGLAVASKHARAYNLGSELLYVNNVDENTVIESFELTTKP